MDIIAVRRGFREHRRLQRDYHALQRDGPSSAAAQAALPHLADVHVTPALLSLRVSLRGLTMLLKSATLNVKVLGSADLGPSALCQILGQNCQNLPCMPDSSLMA
jgi:hypothetical protein